METKQKFLDAISRHYFTMSADKVPVEFVNELSELVTDFYYGQYNRFSRQYPKSLKRYATFQLEDMTHPATFEMVIKYFKDKTKEGYRDFSKQLLNINNEELTRFEKNRAEFYSMW